MVCLAVGISSFLLDEWVKVPLNSAWIVIAKPCPDLFPQFFSWNVLNCIILINTFFLNDIWTPLILYSHDSLAGKPVLLKQSFSTSTLLRHFKPDNSLLLKHCPVPWRVSCCITGLYPLLPGEHTHTLLCFLLISTFAMQDNILFHGFDIVHCNKTKWKEVWLGVGWGRVQARVGKEEQLRTVKNS